MTFREFWRRHGPALKVAFGTLAVVGAVQNYLAYPYPLPPPVPLMHPFQLCLQLLLPHPFHPELCRALSAT